MAESPPAGRHAHLLCNEDGGPTPDRPWIFRTYAGHTSARASNQLFRENLSHGQTGLSIAFDLPTQCGYSSDHPLARPEIGKVGVPINTIDDLHVPVRRHRPGRHQHVDDDQRDRDVAARALPGAGARARHRREAAARHHPERHRQGVPGPRHLHLPAGGQHAAHRRDVRVLPGAGAAVEPVQRVQLSPAGGGRHAGAGAGLLARHRGRAARSPARARPPRREPVRPLRRAGSASS